MIAAIMLATAPLPTAVDAEIAFARDAQEIGMWTAFRKYADRDAVMFTPQAVWVQQALKDRKDPPKAINWRPAHSFTSCDGRTAVNTGPWFGPDGKRGGFFTTVWQRTGRNWRWVYDGGGPLDDSAKTPPARAVSHRASCRAKAPGAPVIPPPPLTNKQARTTPDDTGRGQSADKTLGWDWKVDKEGARKFRVFQWNGVRYAQVLFNDVPAPPKQ
ncbi:MAG TPA: hypothetical protein VM145_01565 [Sphingomicrobium sp.]|nr:hypothetical protein [Sphingomicrobium sp.]